MARIQGKGPMQESDYLPPHIPYVLLCHKSETKCGHMWTVNHIAQWDPAIKARKQHEETCEYGFRV